MGKSPGSRAIPLCLGRLEDLFVEMIFDLRPECKKEGSYKKVLGQDVPGGGNSRNNCPKVGMGFVS